MLLVFFVHVLLNACFGTTEALPLPIDTALLILALPATLATILIAAPRSTLAVCRQQNHRTARKLALTMEPPSYSLTALGNRTSYPYITAVL